MIKTKSIRVYPSQVTLEAGTWYNETVVEVLPENTTVTDVTWSSSNADIASVNPSNGYIYAKSEGKAIIYAKATDGSGVSGFCTVTVMDKLPMSEMVLEKTNVVLEQDQSVSLSTMITPAEAIDKTVQWRSSDPQVVTVEDGEVTAHAVGNATISAVSADGNDALATCEVTVTRDVLVSQITVKKPKMTLTAGDSRFLSVDVSPENATNKNVVWSSSNEEVVTVNPASGYATAHSAGTATIYATAQDGNGERGTYFVTVEEPIKVDSVEIKPSAHTMRVGEVYDLCVEVYPCEAADRSVFWCTENEDVAIVNVLNGKVTAVSAGTTTIRAEAFDNSGSFDVCTITVTQPTSVPAEEKVEGAAKETTVADPVDVYSGAHLLKNTLMKLFGGQGLSLVAEYSSTNLRSSMLGIGWHHNYEKYLVLSPNEVFVYSTPVAFAKYAVTTNPTVFMCTTPGKQGYVLSVDVGSVNYRYRINCNSEKTEYYNADGLLSKVVDHQGFETLISYTDSLVTITDSITGKSIYLQKNADNKITRVYDDAERETVLTYTGNQLTNICDVNHNNLSYTYDNEGKVLYGIDANGVRFFENTYDIYGRVKTQKDAIPDHRVTLFEYYDDGKRVTTNRNNDKSERYFNESGLLVRYVDENGYEKRYSYDENFNITEEIDALEHKITKVYNNFNKPTSIKDKNNHVTTIQYDSAGNVTKIIHPTVDGTPRQETFEYNARNQLKKHTDLRGTLTEYTYDTAGMPQSKKVGNRNPIQYVYENGLLMSQTDARGFTTEYGYNEIGQMDSMTNAEHATTFYQYDAAGNLLWTMDSDGETIVNTYDCNHQKVRVEDANGNITRYSYNGNMKNDLVTLPDNNTIEYRFDGEDRVTKIIDQAKKVTTIEYDKVGNVTAKHFPDGGVIRYGHDEVGNVVTETNPKGGVTEKTYDNAGNVLTVEDPEGNITHYQYNAMGKVWRMTNAKSGTTVYEYSKAGDLVKETNALGKSKTYTYDAFGNKLTETDARGNTTTYTYDANNNLLTVCDALDNITTYTYNGMNQVASVEDARHNTVRYTYDDLGRRTEVTDAKNRVFTTRYDANGNVLKIIDAKGKTVKQTTYNCLNLPHVVTDVTGKTTTYTYTALGKVDTAVDSMNHSQTYSYNARGMNTGVLDAANGMSTAVYDTMGNLTRLTGPTGATTHYTYDNMGRLSTETTASGGTVRYEYDELNLKDKLTNARGQVKTYVNDVMGRVSGIVSTQDTVSYTYDDNGNVKTVTDSNGTITRDYDALNRVSRYVDTFGREIGYQYDAVGNLQRITYPDDTYVTYGYDENNNLTSVTDWQGRITSYGYNENNQVVTVTKPDGSVTTTVYDDRQRIASTVERTASGAIITGYEYTYDTIGRISSEKHLAQDVTLWYTYDALSRVTKRTVKNACNTVVSEETYTYDAAGNITDAPDSCFGYGTNNRLTTFMERSVSYDADGNMLSARLGGANMALSYDVSNRLVSAGGHTYTYNAEDVRIRNVCNGYDTTYTYNTNGRLSQLLMKTTNGITTKYVYGLGLIGEEKQGEFKTYHFDYRGSTVALTDSTGSITDTFEYDTYGNVTERTGDSFVIFGYNGRDGVVTDKNGLIYMRARYYSPEMRRFVNADILRGEISDSTSLNRYSYVNGNPVSFVDPTGYLGIITLMLIGAGISAVVSGVGSVIGQKAESKAEGEEFDLDVGELISDTFWGAVDGAISFSPLGPAGMLVGSTVASVGNSITNELVDDEEGFNYLRAGESVALDFLFGKLELDFLDNVNIGQALKNTNANISKLKLRGNEKWAGKQIARQEKAFNDLLSLKISEEMANGFIGISANTILEMSQIRTK